MKTTTMSTNKSTIESRFGNHHNPALKWIPGEPDTLHIESELTPNNEGEETIRTFGGVYDLCEYVGELSPEDEVTDDEWQEILQMLSRIED